MSDVPDDTVRHEKPPHQLLRQWLTKTIPNEIHRYTFLDPKTDEIRLITLLPSGDETSARIDAFFLMFLPVQNQTTRPSRTPGGIKKKILKQ